MLTNHYSSCNINLACDEQVTSKMRKCRNWQTSKTKDLVAIAVVWVQVPSSAVTVGAINKAEMPYLSHFLRSGVSQNIV